MPDITGVIETVLYVDDLTRARAFYEETLGLDVLDHSERFVVLAAGERQVLLLFRRGAAVGALATPGGVIPGHDASGPIHIGLGVRPDELGGWEARLTAHGVPIESRVGWPRGGHSLYCRDPAGNLVELLTPGTWPVF
jgi:catechol 2,3-dioxygenase-like lactoylglutathione lyase family enzyme